MRAAEPRDALGELRKIPILADLPPPTFQDIAAKARWIRVDHERAMVVEGEPIVAMPVLLQGLVKLVAGRTLVDLVRGPWLALPSAVVDGAPAAVSVVALGPCLVAVLDRAAFLGAVGASATAATKLAELGAQEARSYLRRLPELVGGSVEERLTTLLDRLAERHGSPLDDGRYMALPLRRCDVAMMIHATTETVSRTLAAWERQGWLRSNRSGFWWASRRAREGGLPLPLRPKSDRPEI